MLVQVKELLYWKTEHGNASNCQDAPSYDPAQGLFAVADGASTSLFPALWARILAEHFVRTPLMSNDPFEIEWWVRLAQNEYKQRMPDIHKTRDWNVLQKMRSQGSDSTLATLRITQVDAATARAMLLVFGDSCILIGNPGNQMVSSFILQKPSEFNRAPICVPSDLRYFNRDFHRCQTRSITLNASDQVMLTTDAVARWILEHGEMDAVWEAFQEVYQCPGLDDWYTLVDTKRQCKEMIDDDSTALILRFWGDSAGIGMPLGCVNGHTEEIITQRKQAFEEAANSGNKELLAIAYGDGNDLRTVMTTPPLETINMAHAHEVANALKEVLREFRLAQNSQNLVQKVQPVWNKYGPLLQDEPCATNLRETLRKNGIALAMPMPTPQETMPILPKSLPDFSYQDTINLNDQPKIEEPLQPITILYTFNDLLRQGTNPATLLKAYDAARQANPTWNVPQPNLELLRLAQEFVTAWNANDPYALTKAYRNINTSRFGTTIIFTPEEIEKCLQADNIVQERKEEMQHIIVAKVDEYFVPLENYIGTYIIKQMYIRYLLSRPPSSQAEATELARATNINLDDFPLLVLEELIDNILINRGIKAMPQAASLYQELRIKTTQVVEELKQYEENQPDPVFRRHGLGRKDLNLFAHMTAAARIFATYLHNQQILEPWLQLPTLDAWLRKQKEEEKDTIFFGEKECYAYADRTQTLRQLKQYITTYI